MNTPAMPGLEDEGAEFFDYEAASSDAFCWGVLNTLNDRQTNPYALEEPSAFGASFDNDGAESWLPAKSDGLDLSDLNITHSHAPDDFTTISQPYVVNSAEVDSNCSTDQSG